jgi:hypothetical protein
VKTNTRFIGLICESSHKLIALYQGTTLVVPPPAKMVRAFSPCHRKIWTCLICAVTLLTECNHVRLRCQVRMMVLPDKRICSLQVRLAAFLTIHEHAKLECQVRNIAVVK